MKLILSDKRLDISVDPEKDIHYFDLSNLKIANCMGCFACWTQTPGRCVIRDDATRIYPCIAASDAVLYGAEDEEERAIFRQLVERNARNMNFESYEIQFTTESMIDDMVKQVLQKWEKF